mgnify:CR=1 FL=1
MSVSSKILKKGSILAGLILWAVLLAAGCGSKPVNGEESGESPGYAHMEGLDSVLAASMPLGDESSGTEEGQETENSMESLVREAEGDEAYLHSIQCHRPSLPKPARTMLPSSQALSRILLPSLFPQLTALRFSVLRKG